MPQYWLDSNFFIEAKDGPTVLIFFQISGVVGAAGRVGVFAVQL
jgi:hypothetical protein